MSHADSAPAAPPPIQMLQIMMGPWVAQIAAAVARFEIPDHLARGTRGAAELARLAGADPAAFERLLRAAASVGILRELEPGAYGSTPLGETLRKDVPGSVRDLVIAEMAPGHWLPWGRLHDAIKAGGSQARAALGTDTWGYYAQNPEEGAGFARGMSNLSALVAAEVAPAYDFSRFERIVDVGGSEGVMLAAALRSAPAARGVLFDRPEVIERGRAAVARHQLGARLEVAGGDFLKEVPAGGDLYILKAIVHDWDDDQSAVILANVQRAARPGAKVMVIEMIVPPVVSPSPVHLMDLNMLVMLDGRERTADQMKALLARAGLRFERLIPTVGLFSIVEATRP
ncbi:MAG TPA: methyltransferase [Polyangia bacterium]|nr:methyltransferase [Polyangia bacterium]